MTSLPDALPFSAYRDSVQRYSSKIASSFESVAGKIIAERLPEAYVRAPAGPCFVLWACAVNGGDTTDALPVAAAFDLFERFMLLHDELADASAEAIARWGLGQSLNAGDALYAVAFRSLASDVISPARRLEAARLAGEAVLEALGGRSEPMGGRCALTGAALQAGAVIAGANAETARAFERAGRALGMSADAPDEAQARDLAQRAIDSLAPYASAQTLATFREVAFDIARRTA
ncbi:MAG TPA: hypothetical protein VIX83_07410 [Candidatus Cybelea sp.]